jgi:hypothetical protein
MRPAALQPGEVRWRSRDSASERRCHTRRLHLSKPQASVAKRQREQAKRDRQRLKAERRAQRKNASQDRVPEPEDGPQVNP